MSDHTKYLQLLSLFGTYGLHLLFIIFCCIPLLISFVRDEKRRINIAKETLEVYAPLAGRVGFQLMREELEALAFKQTNPIAYQSLNKRINYFLKKNSNAIFF